LAQRKGHSGDTSYRTLTFDLDPAPCECVTSCIQGDKASALGRKPNGTGTPLPPRGSRDHWYEAAVPPTGPRPSDCPGRHVRWQAAADTDGSGPRGFVLYWRADMTPELTGSGELRPCAAYLMGPARRPEEAYLHDPAVMLFAPLRTLIYIDSADRTRLAVDQPSTVYASFANPVIPELGIDLDRQLAGLLGALGVEAGPWLGQPGGRRRTSSSSSPSASISASTP
jgi:hypothetical protein